MEQQEKKETRGGARPGSGRKKKSVCYYGFRASQAAHDFIEAAGGSKSDFINRCVEFAARHMKGDQ